MEVCKETFEFDFRGQPQMKYKMLILLIKFLYLFGATSMSDTFFSVPNSCWESLWKKGPFRNQGMYWKKILKLILLVRTLFYKRLRFLGWKTLCLHSVGETANVTILPAASLFMCARLALTFLLWPTRKNL